MGTGDLVVSRWGLGWGLLIWVPPRQNRVQVPTHEERGKGPPPPAQELGEGVGALRRVWGSGSQLGPTITGSQPARCSGS